MDHHRNSHELGVIFQSPPSMKLSWSSIVQRPPSHDRTQSASSLSQSSGAQRAIMQNLSNITTVQTLPVPSQGPPSLDFTQPASPLPNLSNGLSAKVQQISSNNTTKETLPVHSQGMCNTPRFSNVNN